MDLEYANKLDSLTKSGRLTPRAQKAFEDMLARNPPVMSVPQKKWINSEWRRHMEGDEKGEYESPNQYSNCKLDNAPGGGYYIIINDIRIGQPVTKKEGSAILAWLTNALDDIHRVGIPTTIENPNSPIAKAVHEKVTKQKQKKKEDKDFGFVEDNRHTNEMIDADTGEIVMEDPVGPPVVVATVTGDHGDPF
jgi:hypothetical protein